MGKRRGRIDSRKKPTLYFDTTIFSSYWYEGTDVLVLGRRLMTHEWWDEERSHFSLLVSSVTEAELAAGRFPRQFECLKMARRLRYLPVTSSAHKLAEELLAASVVPKAKPGDALQMALAVVHVVDYLLTWNYAHLANPVVQERLAVICDKRGIRTPLLVSPETIPKKSLGQTIWREKR